MDNKYIVVVELKYRKVLLLTLFYPTLLIIFLAWILDLDAFTPFFKCFNLKGRILFKGIDTCSTGLIFLRLSIVNLELA